MARGTCSGTIVDRPIPPSVVGGTVWVGGGIAPMYDSRGNVSGWSTAPLCGKRESVCGGATAPMCCKWASLASHYRWWQLTNDSLRDCAWPTCRVIGDRLWCGHGSTCYGDAEKWIWVGTHHGS